jgi:hypothetical protein
LPDDGSALHLPVELLKLFHLFEAKYFFLVKTEKTKRVAIFLFYIFFTESVQIREEDDR